MAGSGANLSARSHAVNHQEYPPTAQFDASDYERDFVLWIERQAELLCAKQFQLLDVGNLLEELDGMKRSAHREMQNRLKILLVHLLKCRYQPQRKARSWLATLDEQRFQIARLVEESPSLAQFVAQYTDKVYPWAVRRASIETGLGPGTFHVQNPFLPYQWQDPDFVP
jgi:hypothetical protein